MDRFNTVHFTLGIDVDCWGTCYLYPTRRNVLLNAVTVIGQDGRPIYVFHEVRKLITATWLQLV